MTGELDVRALLRRTNAKRFLNWERYFALEYDRELRADYRAASIVQVIANVNRGKGQKAYSLEDFRLKFEDAPPKKDKTWQEMQATALLIARMYNAPGLNE